MPGVNYITKKYLTGVFLVSDSRGGKKHKGKKKKHCVAFKRQLKRK